MTRYFIHLAYHGADFHGWQIQPNAVTVQATLQHAFATILQEQIELTGCGRTDSGVHARSFYAHFESELSFVPNNIVFKLNCMLPKGIAIYKIYPVEREMHARFSAISRTYEYYIHQIKNPFLTDRSLFLREALNVEKMNAAAGLLVKKEDFSAFSKSGTQTKTNICTVSEAVWKQQDDQLVFRITADRFLRNMVRAVVGTLLEVGRGKLQPDDVEGIVNSKNRSAAGVSVSAQGLFLVDVTYG